MSVTDPRAEALGKTARLMADPVELQIAGERILRNVNVRLGGCWLWMRSLNSSGYGMSYIGRLDYRVTTTAHQVMYRWLVGPVPVGLELDHLCRERRCVHPLHMEPVTSRENALRGIGPTAKLAELKACRKCGGEFSLKPNGRWRACRPCSVEYQRLRYVREHPDVLGTLSPIAKNTAMECCTRCGGEFSIVPRGPGKTQRRCIACRNQRTRDRRAA